MACACKTVRRIDGAVTDAGGHGRCYSTRSRSNARELTGAGDAIEATMGRVVDVDRNAAFDYFKRYNDFGIELYQLYMSHAIHASVLHVHCPTTS